MELDIQEEVKRNFYSETNNEDEVVDNEDKKWVEEAPLDYSWCAEPRQ